MSKPKILLVVDKPNWAYDQMANYIIQELSHKYRFSKCVAGYHLKSDMQSWGYKIRAPLRLFRKLRDEDFSVNEQYDVVVVVVDDVCYCCCCWINWFAWL